MYTKSFNVWALARAQTWVISHNMGSYTKPSMIWYECNTCEYMYVYKEVLSVSARKGTNKYESAQQGLIYKSICDMIYACLWAYVCIQRGSKCEQSQGERHTWVRTTWVHIQEYLLYAKRILTSSTAQGGGGSFKNRKPIGEIGCCESGMAERIHWWTERCLRSPLFLSLSLTIYPPTNLSICGAVSFSVM